MRSPAQPCVDKIAADHDTSAALSSFAMNGYNVSLILRQELGGILAKLMHHEEGGWIMVLEFEHMRDFVIKEFWVVSPLRAEIVDLIPSRVLHVQEALDVSYVIPV